MEFLFDDNFLNSLSPIDRIAYLKKLSMCVKHNQLCIGQDIIKIAYPFVRKYKIELQGIENVPKDSKVIFLCNHSNSHDIFTAYEMFSMLNRRGSVMVATDCLNPVTTGIFNISDATLLDRNNSYSRRSSVINMSSKIINGNDGLIFGEGTWNLHPVNLMQNIHKGASTISAITGVPIVPTIFEYVEDGIKYGESKLYKKCIIRFGRPIVIDPNNDLIFQTNGMKQEMESIRRKLKSEYGTYIKELKDVDPEVYILRTYLKKFDAFGFTFDSKKEQEFLLFLNGESKENEYTLEKGEFVPGITLENPNQEIQKILRKAKSRY